MAGPTVDGQAQFLEGVETLLQHEHAMSLPCDPAWGDGEGNATVFLELGYDFDPNDSSSGDKGLLVLRGLARYALEGVDTIVGEYEIGRPAEDGLYEVSDRAGFRFTEADGFRPLTDDESAGFTASTIARYLGLDMMARMVQTAPGRSLAEADYDDVVLLSRMLDRDGRDWPFHNPALIAATRVVFRSLLAM